MLPPVGALGTGQLGTCCPRKENPTLKPSCAAAGGSERVNKPNDFGKSLEEQNGRIRQRKALRCRELH
jgi:rRNA maturation protein Nop10